MTGIEKFREEIEREKKRIFQGARIIILDEPPFYLKIRIVLDEESFVEARINSGSKRESLVLVKSGKRIAGFDNLGGWHVHPCGRGSTHRRVVEPLVRSIFKYLADCYGK